MVGPELSPRLPRVLPRWAPEEADYSAADAGNPRVMTQ